MANAMRPLPILAVALTLGVLLGSFDASQREHLGATQSAASLALILALCASAAQHRRVWRGWSSPYRSLPSNSLPP